ncbi:MAG TPA: aminomethyl-transferring glycine dehydrogenase subunit GcvPA, partial [Gammaproteobacteria bacterium]|nr:aminomethyl-transferring glycine dehydrogenase subunit GcvPA [Gammaproteobacteria bacterium]
NEIRAMLAEIGADSIEQLFDEIPSELRIEQLSDVPPAISEMEISRLMNARAAADGMPLSFLGAGAYEHHIPAAVWEITTRGEFYSAYTPYQAEASQGTLQVLYEYQTMMANLMAMEVSNASLYDGASGLAEACLMAVRAQRKPSRRILVAGTLHPYYRETIETIVGMQDIEFVDLAWCTEQGRILPESLKRFDDQPFDALVIPQPNFFGALEDTDALTDWAHAHDALVVGVVNPMAMALLKAPGQWGETGADIVCGEGQPLGVPLSSGGPYFGFLCCRQALVRQMPGRLVGRTIDLDGKEGFTLTLQAREQHIRRSKAKSNICTNQGLLVTAATIYMALLGAEGLKRVAAASHANARKLVDAVTTIDGVRRAFSGPYFHETVLLLDRPVADVLAQLSDGGILGGLDLAPWFPELDNALLVCATETKTDRDIDLYATALSEALAAAEVA